jgi:hypothetical protein
MVSGAADVGVVALSLASSPNLKDKGRYAEIPATEYPPIGSDRGETGDRRNFFPMSNDLCSNSATLSGKTIWKRPVCPYGSSYGSSHPPITEK